MLIVVIVLAVVAVGLIGLLLTTRSSAAEFRNQAEQREEALVAERDELTEARTGLEGELADARAEHDKAVEAHTEAMTAREAELAAATARAEQAEQESAERQATITEKTDEISELVAESFALKNRIEEAEAATAAANARNTGILVGDVIDLGAAQPQTLWDLELKRSERTWRTSVAPNPAAEESPFDITDDPVRTAVEIEAAALRENVGAFITIDWRADPIDDPARSHLVVRVAQEMLEAAARSPEASRLVVTQDSATVDPADGDADASDGDDATEDASDADAEVSGEGADDGEGAEPVEVTAEIKLRLEPAGDDEVINIIPPRITSDLVDMRDETTISIKAPTA